ncbi:circumsporozoite protein isoform X2 [Nematostella vectensis]|uniref:circumsporozoite protein isoform X2 n=1 Tax=Nematostella vectensis TaxID=45351 RepID=UPI00138FDF89|nr:circumsporozoite protein isoform X2 [Nematostella vectensis]
MMSRRAVWLVLACCVLLSAKASQNINKRRLGSNQEHYNVLRRIATPADSATKRSEGVARQPVVGIFKINDGGVVGAGVYEVGKDGKVDIDLKIRITPPGSGGGGGEGSTPTMAPGGGGGSPTKAPGGGGGSPTEAPGGGGGSPTEAPGGGGSTPTKGEGSTSPTPGGGKEGAEDQIALSIHNKFRKVHNSPPMTLNAEMSKSAKEYAEKIAKSGKFTHSSKEERDGVGENLSMGCSSKKGQTPEEAVTNWYNEVCNPGYTFGGGGGGSGTGHFTQVVWKESTELGFGSASAEEDKMKCTYYVGRYKKAGNMIGDFDKNVEQGSFDKQSYCSKVSK